MPSAAGVRPRPDSCPACRPGAVVEARCPVAQVGTAPAPAERGPLQQGLADRRAPVDQLQQRQHREPLALPADQRHAGEPAARIELERQWLQGTIGLAPVGEPDHERQQPMHPGSTALQQQASALFAAGHQRLSGLVQHVDRHGDPPFKQCPYGPGGGALRLAPLGNVCNRLPRSAAIGTFGALPFARMIPTFQSPELRKHSGVGRCDLLQTERVDYRFPWSTQLAFTSSSL